jgi:hypothetical protein
MKVRIYNEPNALSDDFTNKVDQRRVTHKLG